MRYGITKVRQATKGQEHTLSVLERKRAKAKGILCSRIEGC